jgi:imidazolonepropionase-like amidohydrolase
MRAAIAVLIVFAAVALDAQAPAVRPRSTTFALRHVRVVDGSGGPAASDQTIVVRDGTFTAIGGTAATVVPDGVETIDLPGRTVIPGLVGMHEHLFYTLSSPIGDVVFNAQTSFAPLYLAAGVTTIRTGGTMNLGRDVRMKKRVDEGGAPGPSIHLTGSYLNAVGETPDPETIAWQVGRDADAGATSFKAYTSLRYVELKAAIAAAHARGLRVTGHLCAVGFREAAELGIDNVEHGFVLDAGLYPDKRPDECPPQNDVFSAIIRRDVRNDFEIQRTIHALVAHHVAVTSTLAVLESFTGREEALDERVRPLLVFRLRPFYDAQVDRRRGKENWARFYGAVVRQEMTAERAFVAAGGRLLAGVDPTGWGGVAAGFGDQRQIELLAAAGFSPEEAIQIATSNGASFMNEPEIGRIESGKRADLVVLNGDPVQHIADIRKVETVFKRGVAYDPAPLIASVQGTLGAFELEDLNSGRGYAAIMVVAIIIGRRTYRWTKT